jgi:predicted RNase H-like HicB family nuclease
MYRIWYWAMIGRESDGRFVASVPDLGDVAAWGETDKDAIAHVASLAAEHVHTLVDRGEQVPHQSHFSELPSHTRSKEIGRAMVAVEVTRTQAWPTPPYRMQPKHQFDSSTEAESLKPN